MAILDRLGAFKYYLFSTAASLLILVLTGVLSGGAALLTVVILGILEISFSFDNAVVNATKLGQMNKFWQDLFMTVGIIVAVVGVRFLLPIVVVMATAGLGFSKVLDLAYNHPHLYAEELASAHVLVAVAGGVFLLMIFLDFLFDGDREQYWIKPLEGRLAGLNLNSWHAAAITAVVIVGIFLSEHNQRSVLITGFGSLLVYLAMSRLGDALDGDEDEDDDTADKSAVNLATVGKGGLAGLGLFGFLEIQDAAFSFDGVSGAFAISDNVIVIAAGLCIGALFVRGMTVHFVRSGVLAKLRYLEHGAHWAIGVLAICILVSTHAEIPNWITGLIGVVFIIASVAHSIVLNKREKNEPVPEVVEEIDEAVFGTPETWSPGPTA